MTQNMGPADRGGRAVLAVVVAMIALALGAGTGVGIALLVVAGVLLVTAAVGVCPLYMPFHVNTQPRRGVGA